MEIKAVTGATHSSNDKRKLQEEKMESRLLVYSLEIYMYTCIYILTRMYMYIINIVVIKMTLFLVSIRFTSYSDIQFTL